MSNTRAVSTACVSVVPCAAGTDAANANASNADATGRRRRVMPTPHAPALSAFETASLNAPVRRENLNSSIFWVIMSCVARSEY
ncbi:hypothetical protein [Burkholderia ubonensis]|uniref:hypothetical protein n=1 Tax=Burkholderia ubonensis TaxID=101571 RepID=UPI0018AD26F8|nr:hypothetical protein [Burkholderia ubonensis]